ncbi:MAG: transcriptional repressor LexA [Anaerolineae bacterium]|nr:transcriptional repressor LexA [Anaerolineae bacterium]
MTLSERQQRILEFIRQYTAEKHYPPTIREIGQAVGISSTSVVNYNLNILEREGYILRNRDISRGIRLARPETTYAAPVRIPLVGVIVASAPVPIPDSDFAMLGEDEVVELTRDIIADEPGLYALEVRGNSMVDALIHDGDLVIMRHVKEAQNGDLVAVWLKDEKETTLKRFYRERDRVRLQPANPTMEPIYVHPANVEIQGKVVLVIRRLDRVA